MSAHVVVQYNNYIFKLSQIFKIQKRGIPAGPPEGQLNSKKHIIDY